MVRISVHLVHSWFTQPYFMTGFRFTWRCLWIIVG